MVAAGGVPGLGQPGVFQQVGGLQALGQDQPGLRIVSGLALLQLRQCRCLVVTRQPFGGFQAGAVLRVAELCNQRCVAAVACDFQQLCLARRVAAVLLGQGEQPALGHFGLLNGDGAVDDRQPCPARRVGVRCLLDQLLQRLFFQALGVGVGQASPVVGRKLVRGSQRCQLGDGGVPVAQLFGPVGTGLAQHAAVVAGRQRAEPVQCLGRSLSLAELEAVGLPQAHALVGVTGVSQPLVDLGFGRWAVFDQVQAQLGERLRTGVGPGQGLGLPLGVGVALLLGQGLDQQGTRLGVARHAIEQVAHKAFDFRPVVLLRFLVALVEKGIAAEALEFAELVVGGLRQRRGDARQDEPVKQGLLRFHAASRAMR